MQYQTFVATTRKDTKSISLCLNGFQFILYLQGSFWMWEAFFLQRSDKEMIIFPTKKWIENISVLSAVYCSCVSLFDVALENDL
jgi:hypothetical protein